MTPEGLDLVAPATDRLLATLRSSVDLLGEPSRLPGWTRAHVATHLARNADSFTWVLDGACAGERHEQYPGGPATRAAAIEAGSTRPGEEVMADVQRAAARLAAACARVPEAAWSAAVVPASGHAAPLSSIVWARLRELEVHHADLGLRYSPADWPAGFVDAELPRRLDGPDRPPAPRHGGPRRAGPGRRGEGVGCRARVRHGLRLGPRAVGVAAGAGGGRPRRPGRCAPAGAVVTRP